MDSLVIAAILQLINGEHPVELNASCEDIIAYEESTDNNSHFSKEISAILSIDLENKKQWLYQCEPNALSLIHI